MFPMATRVDIMFSNRQFAAALKATGVDHSSHGRGHRNDAEVRQKPRLLVRDQLSRDQISSPLWQDGGATEMHTERKPKAYSYTRFSTPEQAKGDSSTRQALAAERWAKEHNVELDTELTFRDEGISAFDGLNVERGALGAFLKAVQSGDVPKGSWLLVESLDRISRQKPRKAARLMEDIVEAGVIVVDLYDGAREYSTEALDNDNFLLVQMVLRFIRANEESEIKAARVAAARRRSRERFASDQPLTEAYTKQLPGWLRWNEETKVIEPIPERAEIVRKMFEMADAGSGQHKIAAWLNTNAGEPWGRGKRKGCRWHRSYVRKVLTNRAVIGIFTPHIIERDPKTRRKTRKPADPITHRFPAIVDRDLFERVSSRIGTTAPRGKNSGAAVRSIFAGILKCRHCGGTVTRVSKGKHVYLVCSAANSSSRSCHYEAVPYSQAEEHFVLTIRGIIDEAPRGKDTAELEEQIAKADVAADALFDMVQELLVISIEEKSAAARKSLSEREAALADAEERARRLRERRGQLATAAVRRRLSAIEQALTEQPLDIHKANAALREAIERMVIFPAEGRIEIFWRHADQPQDAVLLTRKFDWTGGRPQSESSEGNANTEAT
jgi:DNA invertase Pin-like site-specific DNA recombinase